MDTKDSIVETPRSPRVRLRSVRTGSEWRTLPRLTALAILAGIAAGGAFLPGAQAQTPQNVYATTRTSAGPSAGP